MGRTTKPGEPVAGAGQGVRGSAGDYRISPTAEPAVEIRRVAAARLDHALEQLRDREPGTAGAIHEARKDLKKARSLLRLVRGRLEKGARRRDGERLRDAGRMLSDVRDAEVKLEALAALRERGLEGTEMPAYADALERERRGAERGEKVEGRIDRAAGVIQAVRGEIAGWPLEEGEWTPAGRGLRREYARGRAAFAAARDGGSDELVHDWRKRAKDLWYHLRLLAEAEPEAMRGRIAEAHELSTLLGSHHDLAVLAADARGRLPAGSPALEELEAAARRRQAELFVDAERLGERLYAEKPKAFRRRLRDAWRAALGR
jgi:CHAD domain-containing protein